MAKSFDELYQESLAHKNKGYGIGGGAQDIGVAALKGGISVGQGLVGLGNLATGGAVGEGLSKLGYDSQATNQILNNLHTEQYKQGQQEVQQAGEIEGSQLGKGLNTLGALVSNPMQAVGAVVESIPLMLPGLGLQSKIYKGATAGLEGVAKEAAIKQALPKMIAAGAGMEGLQQAGSLADQAQQAGRPYSDYALPALASGVGDAAIAATSGLALGDAVTGLLAGKGLKPIKGMLTEGLAEELPQSIQEKVAENVAFGNPDLLAGTGAAGAQGAVAGGIMGGVMGTGGVLTRAAQYAPPQPQQNLDSVQQAGKNLQQNFFDTANNQAAESAPVPDLTQEGLPLDLLAREQQINKAFQQEQLSPEQKQAQIEQAYSQKEQQKAEQIKAMADTKKFLDAFASQKPKARPAQIQESASPATLNPPAILDVNPELAQSGQIRNTAIADQLKALKAPEKIQLKTDQKKAANLLAQHGSGFADQYSIDFGMQREDVVSAIEKLAIQEPKTAINMLETYVKQVVKPTESTTQPSKYHPGIKTLANELQVNGDSAAVRDKIGNITGRTASVNPDWFKNGRFTVLNEQGVPFNRTASVRDIQQTVAKYQEGKPTNRFETGILKTLDSIAKEREQEAKLNQADFVSNGLQEPSVSALAQTETSNTESANSVNTDNNENSKNVIDLEDYLSQAGYGKATMGDAATHRSSNKISPKTWRKTVEEQAKKDRAIMAKRAELEKEYNEKVVAGEVRSLTRTEKLIKTAQGHDDNASVQAARRLLNKKGISYSINQKNSTSTHTPATLRAGLSKVFGQGWLTSLLATDKFKIINRAEAKPVGANDNAQAFYNPKDDTTYFVADNIDQSKDLKKLMLHELGVHALQLGRNTPQFQAILKQIEELAGRRIKSKSLQAAITAAEKAGTSAELMNEEIAGYLVEFHPDLSISQRIIAFFRGQLRRLGLLNGLTEQDVVYMARQALKSAPESLVFDGIDRNKNDVLFSAEKEGYRGDNIEEADEWLRAKAKGLDMSFEARMARAKAMGFDVDTTYYHGTNAEFNEFEKGKGGIFFTTNQYISDIFGKSKDYLISKGDKPFNIKIGELTDEQREYFNDLGAKLFDEDDIDDFSSDWDGLADAMEWGNLYLYTDRQTQNMVLRKIEADGYTSVDMPDYHSDGSDQVLVVFNPSQVRSEDAAFDPEFKDSPSILASYAPTQGDNFTIPGETVFDRTIRHWQNYLRRFEIIQKSLVEQGGTVTDNNNVVQAAEEMPHIAGEKVSRFNREKLKPLLERINALDTTADDIALLLYARHAKERNAAMAKINPKFAQDGGSGMTNQEADDTITELKAHYGTKFAEIEALAKDWQKITQDSKQLLLDGGVITQEEYDKWSSYNDYVPLKGFEVLDESSNKTTGTGLGNSTGKQFSKRALGRKSRAGQILENIIRDRERAIIWTEKTNVVKTLHNLVIDNPDDAIWTVDQIPTEQRMGANGKVVDVKIQFDPEKEVRYIKDGKEVRIQLKDKLAVQAFNRLNEEALTGIYAAGSEINRFLRQAWTQKNPAFFLINPIRDIQTASIVLAGYGGIGLSGKMLKNWSGSLADMWAYSNEKTSKNQAVLDRYLKSGGMVNTAYVSTLEQTQERMRNQLARLGSDSITKMVARGEIADAMKTLAFRTFNNTFFDLIENLNQAFEGATRLATFKAAIESGISDKEAARMASNVTVNFTRRGEYSKQLGAMYLFANANIQGTQNLFRTLTQSKHKGQAWAIVSGLMGLGFMAAMMSGDDGEDDLVPDYEKERSITFEYAPGKRLAIPLPYGFSWFRDFGRAMAQVANGGDAEKISKKLASSFLGNFSPVGNPIPGGEFEAGNAIVAFAPTFAKPAVMPALNKSAFGSELMPESPFKPNQPDSQKVFRKTRGTGYEGIAQGLNSFTGGDEAQSGWIDISPETIKNTINYIVGGSGRFLTDTAALGETALSANEDATLDKTPIAKAFFKSESIDDYRRRFYSQSEEVAKVAEQMQTYKKQRDFAKIRQLRSEKGDLLRLAKFAKAATNRLKILRDLEDVARNNKDYGRIDDLEKKQKDLLIKFNSRL